MLRRVHRLTRRFLNSAPRTPANHTPLSPVSWLERSAVVFGDAEAVRHGDRSRTWLQTRDRAVSLADALRREYGVGRGDCVQVMLHNTPEMLEAHFGVPMSGATLGSINTRLDATTVAYILKHSEAKVLIVDADRAPIIDEALGLLRAEGAPTPTVLQAVDDTVPLEPPPSDGSSLVRSAPEYEALLQSGRSTFAWQPPVDEFDAIALNYTSGSTGRPKGCVLHHRGAYMTALGNMAAFGGMANESSTRYLWTLPMFHCNGWNFPYTVAALGGLNICMRAVDEAGIAHAFAEHGVTHLCGAPIILRMAIGAAAKAAASRPADAPPIKMFVAASPPPAATLRDAANVGLDVTHVYGLTEVYGPAALCEWREAWSDKGVEEQAVLKARQGAAYITQEAIAVLDPDGQRTPADGETLGEVCFRGNMVMKGYHKDPEVSTQRFKRSTCLQPQAAMPQPQAVMPQAVMLTSGNATSGNATSSNATTTSGNATSGNAKSSNAAPRSAFALQLNCTHESSLIEPPREKATEKAFFGGWFRTGDLGVTCQDGCIHAGGSTHGPATQSALCFPRSLLLVSHSRLL